MEHFLKVKIYETQAILYWILGVLILHLGNWHWVGWLSIGWGWVTFLYIIVFTVKYKKELKEFAS